MRPACVRAGGRSCAAGRGRPPSHAPSSGPRESAARSPPQAHRRAFAAPQAPPPVALPRAPAARPQSHQPARSNRNRATRPTSRTAAIASRRTTRPPAPPAAIPRSCRCNRLGSHDPARPPAAPPRSNRPPRARRPPQPHRRAPAATPPGAPPRAPGLAPSAHPPASGQQNALFLASDDGFATSFPPSRAPEPGWRNRDLGFSGGTPTQTAAFAAPAGRKRLQTRHRLPENRPDPAQEPCGLRSSRQSASPTRKKEPPRMGGPGWLPIRTEEKGERAHA